MSRRQLLALLLLLSSVVAAGALVDADGDGLRTVTELRVGTHPLTPDTDGDGLVDGTELARSTDPLVADTDGDGLADGSEVDHGTDPLVADTDGDGLSDGRERALGTDPTRQDTDRDTLTDGAEVDHGTDPLSADTDGDGLDDGRERELGTDPTSRDTDGDGLTDAVEVAGTTDPTLADTDGDGLDDGRELALETDPRVADTDADGLRDGREVDLGADPLDPDTDDDGFRDGAEVHRRDVLPSASPTRKDVYVEVDAVTGTRLPRDEAQRVVDAYLAAPVGRAGSQGIRLHVVYNESGLPDLGAVRVSNRPNYVGADSVSIRSYTADHYDYRGYGYHYLLVVPEVLDVPGQEVIGETEDWAMAVQSVPRRNVRGSTFMHELGHSMGLDRHDFDGIDAHRYPIDEYASVMNYNAPSGYYGYSDGPPFDDWAAIEAAFPVPDTSRLSGDG